MDELSILINARLKKGIRKGLQAQLKAIKNLQVNIGANINHSKMASSTKKATQNYKQAWLKSESDLANKMAAVRNKSQIRVRKDEIKSHQKQAAAINKNTQSVASQGQVLTRNLGTVQATNKALALQTNAHNRNAASMGMLENLFVAINFLWLYAVMYR